jgi:hypothetical protein
MVSGAFTDFYRRPPVDPRIAENGKNSTFGKSVRHLPTVCDKALVALSTYATDFVSIAEIRIEDLYAPNVIPSPLDISGHEPFGAFLLHVPG